MDTGIESKAKDDSHRANMAMDRAIEEYIHSRRRKVPPFAKKNFSLKGALKINKKAVGSDLYKAPLNMAWALPYTGLRLSSALFVKMGFQKIPSLMEKLPVGFETAVQREVNWLLFTELLEIPLKQGERKSEKDALLEEIMEQPEITSLLMDELSEIHSKSKDPRFRSALEKNLKDYSRSRIAVAELAGSIISLSAGAGMFGKMTPGAMTFGGGIAAFIAQNAAISNFIFGPTLGSFYYGVFPASASLGLVVASTGTVLAGLAVLTAFSGILTDPIQYKLGFHQKRLNRLIDCLDEELKGRGESELKIREQYLARIFDLVDLLKVAARTVV